MTEERQETLLPLYLLCVDADHQASKALRYACEKVVERGARIGLFNTIEIDEFLDWGMVEEAMKNELRQQKEQDLWEIASYIRVNHDIVPEFYIEEGESLDALLRIAEAYPETVEIIVAAGKKDIQDYLDIKAIKKIPRPLVFIADEN